MKYSFLQVFLALGLIWNIPAPIETQTAVEFRNAKVENGYPEGITFGIEICGRPTPSNVIFNYTSFQESTEYWGWTREKWSLDEGQTSDDCDIRKFRLETKDLEAPPFSPIRYFWSVTKGTETLGRSPTYVYQLKDERYDWKSLENAQLAVWWHDRPDSFGKDAMDIASRAHKDQAEFYSYSLESPITVVIVNTSEEFFAWQAEQDYAAGLAFYDRFLTIQLVEDDANYYDWLGNVLPHEISHIHFDHLVKRYSGASYWLNEGLATYNEYSDHLHEWNILKGAHERGEILSLKDLEYGFGEDTEKVDVAYAESYYAVLYMEEVYGKDSIANLLHEFAIGTGATVAFQRSFGKDPEEFEIEYTSWLEERLKTLPPTTAMDRPLQGNPNKENSVDRTTTQLPYREILLVIFLGAMLTSILLKPRRKSL